jgi:hypothetical protein
MKLRSEWKCEEVSLRVRCVLCVLCILIGSVVIVVMGGDIQCLHVGACLFDCAVYPHEEYVFAWLHTQIAVSLVSFRT